MQSSGVVRLNQDAGPLASAGALPVVVLHAGLAAAARLEGPPEAEGLPVRALPGWSSGARVLFSASAGTGLDAQYILSMQY